MTTSILWDWTAKTISKGKCHHRGKERTEETRLLI